MKHNKNLNLTLMILLVLLSFSCRAQQIQIQEPNLSDNIIGTWLSNEEPTHKLVFTVNGLQQSYHNNTLSSTFSYSITTQCKLQTLTTNYDIFLKVIDLEDNEVFCHLLNGIHTDTNGVITLSITSERGKLYLYTKQ
ncbi:MAG: hypothetical protein L3J25_07185 [Flavobacteriaceae bacterium]|nr:hypothetical protein [Flavobacteriaceae bacterium]